MTIGRPKAAINGFGRFGLGLFRSWFEDLDKNYDISYINDDALNVNDIVKILKYDDIVHDFRNLHVSATGDILCIRAHDGHDEEIVVTNSPIELASWLGAPELIFECSGITRNHENCRDLLISNTNNIIIGCTIDTADATLIMGYNHTQYRKFLDRVISFGSCTVIPGVHLIAFIKKHLGLKKCLINIIHSVPKWQLDAGKWKTISRKACSLERVAPKIVQSVEPTDLKVNYTYAPYYGVSLMDFGFSIERKITIEEFVNLLLMEINEGSLKNIASLIETDTGAENQINSRSSIVIVRSSIDVRDDTIHFFGYFNNEGSGIRLHELAKFIIQENEGKC